ncbi:hypothetical protein, partial [Dysosmobacter sp.]|uniref:hypothetical protein n=1 Tax=Dysosmobacter sp. TaxID=2591382 RepID=UPI003AB5495A
MINASNFCSARSSSDRISSEGINALLQTDEFATHWHRAAEDKDIENYIAEHTLLETDAGTLKLS